MVLQGELGYNIEYDNLLAHVGKFFGNDNLNLQMTQSQNRDLVSSIGLLQEL